MKEKLFTKYFEKSTNISGNFFYAGRHTDKGTEIINLMVEIHNFVTPSKMCYKSTEGL